MPSSSGASASSVDALEDYLGQVAASETEFFNGVVLALRMTYAEVAGLA